ncbi:tyrosine-type recombinase/integrase [Aeromonas taiwanensis]|uniref:tyrosine-type recombinase/integrase n=1 Tax=Aeromonas taiwanensis TaxID=633417 RepID=UPI003F745692
MWNKLSNKVGNIPHYLTRRNGVFYACFRLPTALSQRPKVIRRSLQTRDAGLAHLRLAQWLPVFLELKQMAAKSDSEKAVNALIKLKAIDLDMTETIRDHLFEQTGIESEAADQLRADFASQAAKRAARTSAINVTKDRLKRSLSLSDDEALKASITVQSKEQTKQQALQALYQGDLPAYLGLKDSVLTGIARQGTTGDVCSTLAPAMTETSQLLSESYKKFIKFKKNLTGKMIKDYDRYLDFTLAMLGDIETHNVTKQALRECLEVYQQMPKGNLSPYNTMSMADKVDLAKAGEIEKDHLIAAKTAGELLKFYQSLFSAFLTDEKDMFTTSPTTGLKKPPSEDVTWGAYTKAQGRQIYEYWLAQPDSPMRWVFLLVLFTGMRRSEIANVSRYSLKQDQDSGRYYLWIQEGKTAAATRPVTIAKELEALGFVEYLRSLDGVLYPAERLNDITERANKVRQLLEIGETEENGKGRLVFHSFRHSFVTFKQAKNVDYHRLQRFVGHEGARSITKRYTHDHMITDYSDIADGAWWA